MSSKKVSKPRPGAELEAWESNRDLDLDLDAELIDSVRQRREGKTSVACSRPLFQRDGCR